MVTWSIRRIAVAAKPSETKLQVGREELRQTEHHKLCSQDLANSEQSLWCIACHGSSVSQGFRDTTGSDCSVLERRWFSVTDRDMK